MHPVFPSFQIIYLLLATVFSSLVFSAVRTRYRTGLRKIPGPWLASISGLDRARSCATGLQMNYHLRLHERYGEIVRVGPKHVSFSNTDLIPTVYSIGSKFYKVRSFSPTKETTAKLTMSRVTSTRYSTSKPQEEQYLPSSRCAMKRDIKPSSVQWRMHIH